MASNKQTSNPADAYKVNVAPGSITTEVYNIKREVVVGVQAPHVGADFSEAYKVTIERQLGNETLSIHGDQGEQAVITHNKPGTTLASRLYHAAVFAVQAFKAVYSKQNITEKGLAPEAMDAVQAGMRDYNQALSAYTSGAAGARVGAFEDSIVDAKVVKTTFDAAGPSSVSAKLNLTDRLN